jgi:hypothetical protein
MRTRAQIEDEIRAQLPQIRERSRLAAEIEPRAAAAWYDPVRDLVMIQLTSGSVVGIRRSEGRGLENATAAQLGAVEVDPGGEGLHWEELDADISVPGIIYRVLGIRRWAASWSASEAGSRTSSRKAAAARANGAKGGRPRRGAEAKAPEEPLSEPPTRKRAA